MPDSDDDLLQQFVTGADSAFSILVERYKRPLYYFILRKVKDTGLASDLTQDVFVQVFQAAKSYRSYGKFKYWLFRIAHNLCIDAHRRQSRARIVALMPNSSEQNADNAAEWPVADETDNPVAKMEYQEVRQRIDLILADLPEEQRQAFILCQFQGLRYHEIADIQECPLGTVKSRVHQAVMKIRSALKDGDLL